MSATTKYKRLQTLRLDTGLVKVTVSNCTDKSLTTSRCTEFVTDQIKMQKYDFNLDEFLFVYTSVSKRRL